MNVSTNTVTLIVVAMLMTLVIGVLTIVELERSATTFRAANLDTQVILGTRIDSMGNSQLVIAK